MQSSHHRLHLILILILIIYNQNTQSCEQFPSHLIINSIGTNKSISPLQRCFTLENCRLTILTTDHHHLIDFQSDEKTELIFPSINDLSITYTSINSSLFFFSLSNTNELSTDHCHRKTNIIKRSSKSDFTSSKIITFNSSAYLDYHYEEFLDYPIRLSLRFRTLGRISNGVLLSLTHRKSSSLMIPFIIIEHSNGKIEITILQLDERKILSTVTTIQCGKNINNDNWHWLQFDIDQNGIFTLVVNDDTRTSQIPTYVVANWNTNALLVGDTRRLSSDIFQPFVGYMSDLIFNDEYLFENLIHGKFSSARYESRHIVLGYRIAFFNLATIETSKSYIAFSERENQNKNHGKLDIYFLFRSHVSNGIILYRYAQGLNEYFAIGLRDGILALFIDFGFGKRQIVSDQSTRLADGKWHEVRVTRIGTDKIELIVDNRVNRSTLSTNGIRNAVSLQPVLYIGGIPNSNQINLTGSGLNAQGFQGCLASFIVDGRLLDYQRALVLNGQVKMNVCSANSSNFLFNDYSDLNKLCYDFTCFHSGICSTNDNDEAKCDCLETGYGGERCDKLPKGFYFGKHHSVGSIEYALTQARQTEYDTIGFGIQTLASSAQIFRLESDLDSYSLEYELVGGRSFIKLNLGEKQPEIYSALAPINDGVYHTIKVIRRLSKIEFYVDENPVNLKAENKNPRQAGQRAFLAQRRLRIGNFQTISPWNGILAGLYFNRQSIFDSLSKNLIHSGDVQEISPDPRTGHFYLVDSFYVATAIISSTTTTMIIPIVNETIDIQTMNLTKSAIEVPIMDNIYHQEYIPETSVLPQLPAQRSFEWFYQQVTHFGIRGLLIGSVLSICLLLLLLCLIIHLHCKNRHAKKKISCQFPPNNGTKTYSNMKSSPSKKSTRKFLRYLHNNQSKPSSYRLASNGSIARLNSSDSYHLISSIQENCKEKNAISYQNSDCLLNEHSSTRTGLSPSIYHQVNRLINPEVESILPLSNLSQSHAPLVPISASLRSGKKDVDNSSVQTYSAVYSCELASNLDIDQDFLPTHQTSVKRKSILRSKNLHSNQILFLYMKNLIDCYAIQPNHLRTMLLATADENRVHLHQLRSGSFHSQLPVSSVGACHKLLYSFNGQFLIGLFYEVTSNVNPYAVKIWSTDDYSIRTNLHPIKCSIAIASRHSSILYMAGKQKYGRGISLGLLDIDSCSLARELKSDPDTSIGDEIKRIILTKNETYALVACTEYNSTLTCFVVFKLDPTLEIIKDDDPSSLLTGSMSNCTMILTRFNCDANSTYSIVDSNNNGDQYMLTILRTQDMIIWQLNDGEILFNYSLKNFFPSIELQSINHCQINDNRLLILFEQGLLSIWDIFLPTGQIILIANISDPLIHSISWLDHQHFLSIDHDGQRIRTWDIARKEAIHETLSMTTTIQSIDVHSHLNPLNNQKDNFLCGISMNERSLVMFEYPDKDHFSCERIDSPTTILRC